MRIYVNTDVEDDDIYVFCDAWLFMQHFGNSEDWIDLYYRKEHTQEDLESVLSDSVHLRQ